MKRMLIVMALACSTAQAADQCEAIAELAGTIMNGRQKGIELSKMMEVARRGDDWGRQLSEFLLIMAYEQPRYNTESMQGRAIGDFKNSIYLQCLKSVKK